MNFKIEQRFQIYQVSKWWDWSAQFIILKESKGSRCIIYYLIKRSLKSNNSFKNITFSNDEGIDPHNWLLFRYLIW